MCHGGRDVEGRVRCGQEVRERARETEMERENEGSEVEVDR